MEIGVGNLVRVKRINRLKVLDIIRKKTSISRKELAEATGLTPAAITGIVRDLTNMGFVIETGPGLSNGGRPPINLVLNPESGFVVGVEVTNKKTFLGIVNLMSQLIVKRDISIDMSEPEEGIRKLCEEIGSTVKKAGIDWEKVLKVGFAFPGLLDIRTMEIKRSPNLGVNWKNVPVATLISKYIDRPILVEHNANAAALAARSFGLEKEIDYMVYINLGEGISAGVVMNGRISHGFSGFLGEVGHTVIMENGPLCNCGNRGCLEALCAVPSLVKRANRELPLYDNSDKLKQVWLREGKVTIDDIIATASEDGSYSQKLINQAGWSIGTVVAGIINFYNPETVCLGGVLTKAKDSLIKPLLKSVATHAFSEIAEITRIEISGLGEEAGYYGACISAINKLFAVESSETMSLNFFN